MPLDPLVKQVAPAATLKRSAPKDSLGEAPRLRKTALQGRPVGDVATADVGEVPQFQEGVVQKAQRAIKMTPKAAVGALGDVLDILRTGEFVTAGLAEEYRRITSNEDRLGWIKSVENNIKERRGYSEFTGNLLTDLGMSIMLDPLTYVPGGAFIKAGRAIGLAKGAKKLGEATDAVKSMRQIKEMMGKFAGGPTYMLRKYHPELAKKMGHDETVNAVAGAAGRHGEDMERLVRQIAPDSKRAEEILNFAETVFTRQRLIAEGVKEAMSARRLAAKSLKAAKTKEEAATLRTALKESAGEVKGAFGALTEDVGRGVPSKILASPEFAARYASLSKDEKFLFRTFRQVLAKREEALILAERIERSRAAKFILANGMNYVPHRRLTKAQTIARLKAELKAIEAGDPMFKGADPEAVKAHIKLLGEMDEFVSDAGREMMQRWNQSPKSWMWRKPKERKVRATIDEIARDRLYDINKDLGDIMGLAKAEAVSLKAGAKYIDSMTQYLVKKGVLLDEQFVKDPLLFRETVVKRLGAKESALRMREGWKPITGVKSLQGLWAPKAVADEIQDTMTLLTKPEALEEFFKHFAKVQNFWKAWTLAVFPSYHSRNHISNVWNNFLAGLGRSPLDVRHYETARKIVHHGMRDYKFAEGAVVGGRSQKQLWELARDMRVVRSGEMTGELGRTVAQRTDPRNLVNPLNWVRSDNPVVRGGFRVGQYIEDTDRMAHFIWRLSKGDTAQQAGKSVQKYLFDYTYGLTKHEKKWMRNFMAPFYAWTRFNLPLQLEMIATSPAKFTGVKKGIRAYENQFGGPDPEDIYMAQWLQQSEKIRLRYNKEKNEYEYFMLDSWWPAADVRLALSTRELGEQMLNMVSPFLKLFPELLANYSLFQKRKISEYPGHKKKILKVPVDARLEHLFRNVRIVNEVDRILQAIDRGSWTEAVMRPVVGKVYPQNFEQQKKWWLYYQKRQLGELKRQKNLAEKRGSQEETARLEELVKTQETYIKEWD